MSLEAASYLAEGTLYVNQKLNGIAQGWRQWRGLAGFEYKANSEIKEQTTKDKGKYAQIIASVALPKPSDLTITINQVTGVTLAAQLQGEIADLAEAAGTVTDEVVVASPGGYAKLAHRNIGNAVVVTDSAGTITYVLGTDYKVNYVAGLLEFIAGGAITAGQSLKVDYPYNAVSGQRVKASTVPQIIGELFLDGRNLVDGKHFTARIWQANLTSDSGFNPLSDDFVSLTMKGRAITPEGKDSPLEVDVNLDFAV